MSAPAESKPDSLLEATLLAEAPRQWERFQRSKAKRVKGLPKWRRELEEIDSRVNDSKAKAEELRRQYDPELIRIQANMDRKTGITSSLCCPKCHDTDHGNKMNGKPWCMKCSVRLESPSLVKTHFPDVKVLPKSKRFDVTFRGLEE